ncbi:MAG: phage portal protein [Streptosporangiales bacterium]
MVDVQSPGSAGWWLARLGRRLDDRRARYDLLDRYFRGDHRLPEGDDRCRDMFRRFQRKARTNYVGLVAESVRERLHPVGFRTGGASSGDVDDEAWRIWQANYLDADSGLVHLAALVFSDAYVCVGANPNDDRTPVITPEDPREVIVETDPVNRRLVRAGLKLWTDDLDKTRHAVLYLPDKIHYFSSRADETNTGLDRYGERAWEVEQDPRDNAIGAVPLVRFVNRPTLSNDGLGEFEDLLDVQDRINNTVLDRLVISKLQAYRQRWVKNIPTEDEDGNPLDLPFVPGVDLLWAVDAPEAGEPEAAFGEFEQVNLTPLLEAVKEDRQALVMLSGLPPHYVAGDLINASEAAMAAAETRLVAKVRERMRHFGESWEAVIRLAFRYVGDDARTDSEMLWADPERKTDAQLADAADKKMTAGVPWHQRMVDLHYSPQEIKRMESDRASDALHAALAAPLNGQPERNGQASGRPAA